MKVKIIPNDRRKGASSKPLAAAELHFDSGPLAGLKLIGFTVWENKRGIRTVGFPSRAYTVNGERRSFALLRPIDSSATADAELRQLILTAYEEHK